MPAVFIVRTATGYFVDDIYQQTGSTETKYYFPGGSFVAMRVPGAPTDLLSDHSGLTPGASDGACR